MSSSKLQAASTKFQAPSNPSVRRAPMQFFGEPVENLLSSKPKTLPIQYSPFIIPRHTAPVIRHIPPQHFWGLQTNPSVRRMILLLVCISINRTPRWDDLPIRNPVVRPSVNRSSHYTFSSSRSSAPTTTPSSSAACRAQSRNPAANNLLHAS